MTKKRNNCHQSQIMALRGFNCLVLSLLLITVRANVSGPYTMVVARDGSGDYTTIQAAIDACKSFPDDRISIFIKNGVYKEKVRVPAWNDKLSLIGESVEHTIISFDDYFNRIDRGRNSTFFTYTLLVEGNDFYAENLTIENTAGPVGQAVALHVESDRCAFHNCRFLGNQDTLYAAGQNSRQYYDSCYIEGTTDFIFGAATAVFNVCTIHSKSNSFITAASTPEGRPFGYVFRNCKLTAALGINKVYLGRPWRDYARVAFLNCSIGDHIIAAGWDNWSTPIREKTSFFTEYGNTGPGAATSGRVRWSHQLSKREASMYTIKNIFKARTVLEPTIREWTGKRAW
jgi:pectinesterase